jgi:hypothetical protein
MEIVKVGGYFRKKKILDFVKLSNGWYVLKTENKKSPADFKVRTIFSLKPLRSLTPKHAHFAIDFYGKLCADREKALKVFKAIIEIWNNKPVRNVIKKYENEVVDLPGYNLEYILFALRWILDQEDVNFTERPARLQRQLDKICEKQNVIVPSGRKGSQLAISLFCDLASGAHPVEAFHRANLEVLPRRRR